MTLENEVLDSLEDLIHPNINEMKDKPSILVDWKTFSSIVSWISDQMQKLVDFESLVNSISDESELTEFKIELNSCLRELNSPYIDSQLLSDENKLSLLNHLCGELLSMRMIHYNDKSGGSPSMAISMNESQTAKDLKTIVITLGMGKPPNNISADILFKKIKDKLIERIAGNNFTIEDSLLLPNGLTLSPKQWQTLQSINKGLLTDFTLRRDMLLKRCDCTVKSFSWKSDKNITENKINEVYREQRDQLTNKPNVTLADALAARQSDCDELLNSVISNKHAKCMITSPETYDKANKGLQQKLQLHKYLIGSVPDRGGRPHEQQKPKKETFDQQKYQRDNPQRGRGRAAPGGQYRGGGGGRGGGFQSAEGNRYQDPNPQRVQGSGWAQNTGNRYADNGSYDNHRGGNREQQSYSNYQSGGHHRYGIRDDSQQNTGYHQSQQQQWNQYNNQQQYEKPGYSHSYSEANYGNSARQQYQSDSNYYNDQRNRNNNQSGYRRGGRR